MRYYNLIIIGLASSVSAHANFQPPRVLQDTDVKVTLNLPHSCTKKYTGVEDSPIVSVTIVYPEVLVENNVQLSVTPLAEIPAAGSSHAHSHGATPEHNHSATSEHNHGTELEDNKTDIHQSTNNEKTNENTNEDEYCYVVEQTNEHAKELANHQETSKTTVNKNEVDHHASHHSHGSHDHHQHVHRRHDISRKNGMNITFTNLDADMIDFALSFKTPRLDQLSSKDGSILFTVQQFCKNGKYLSWVPGDENYPAAKLILLEKNVTKPAESNVDSVSSSAELITSSLILFTLSLIYTIFP